MQLCQIELLSQIKCDVLFPLATEQLLKSLRILQEIKFFTSRWFWHTCKFKKMLYWIAHTRKMSIKILVSGLCEHCLTYKRWHSSFRISKHWFFIKERKYLYLLTIMSQIPVYAIHKIHKIIHITEYTGFQMLDRSLFLRRPDKIKWH